MRTCAYYSFVSVLSSRLICIRKLTSVRLHVLQEVVVELELDATGTTSVGL